ncbi:ABC transporter ATP-binding protein [Paenibacillus alginolyticus]|uniref:ABC transporter ATP-binding protein n=1 Tax=Paenibacillus alginolyticus TaxID=59839 RepID=A0ABT4GN15_9BACL|nr:ABC transporter ATP-binding protein [Paenibacillus alginolyticus]MCY9667475.1 ABC transporter ATP-binding protein [Paenibacillus alginolyticus]MCY9697621.1 ABC transporter ATP-binding protein [Paenibacillus alginolyticus]MEC0144888.1 ABC transporter ATP-binding protein [Paenibacillus alginolyticus]
MKRVLEACQLYRFYHAGDEETLALRGVSLYVDVGEIVAVMGPSGSGKSTLLSCLVGLDEPDGGYVQVCGNRLTRRTEEERAVIRGMHIGILLQSRNLFSHLTVADNIRLKLRQLRSKDESKIRSLLSWVHMEERIDAYPSQLSGGEAARAGLALALCADPKLLVADEPTGEVDLDTETSILRLLDERRSSGGATLIATHSDRVAALADRVITIHDGRIANEFDQPEIRSIT